VYIIVLPAFGIVSEIIPVFSRKPIFGYPFMVFSGIAIGFMGWGVWAHHMFASGIGPVSVAAFSLATMFIAVPTGVKVLNWLGTMWGGSIQFTTAMKYAVSLVAMFTIGGLSGVSHSIAPADTQQTDTYYIVGHFHYTIFGGGALGFLGGLYFWWPKAFGYKLSEKIGNWNFWLVFIGFNLTFAPMHILGLQGMSRRIYTYDPGLGFETWNMVATIGSYVLGLGMLLFVWNVYRSTKRRHLQPPVGPDPWDGRSLEWMLPSPTPEHNFDEVPDVTRLDEFWHRKYDVDEAGRVTRRATAEEVAQKGDATDVHLPSPSYWPLVLASGMPLIGYGLIFNLIFLGLGVIVVLVAILGWALEPSSEPGGHGGHDDDHSGSDDHGDAASAAAEAAEAAEAQEIVEQLIEAATLPRRGSEGASNG
jgi:cytochrome c oxidase subunit 1